MTRYTPRRLLDYRFPWSRLGPLGWGIVGFCGGGLLVRILWEVA